MGDTNKVIHGRMLDKRQLELRKWYRATGIFKLS